MQNGTDQLKLNYDYGTPTQNNGSLRTQTITVPTVGANAGFTATQSYNYDSLNRISDATETISGVQTWKQSFLYDRYGNKTFDAGNTTTVTGCGTAVCNPTISTSNNRFSTGQGYSYDPDGAVTQDASGQRFGCDAESRQNQFFAANNSTGTPDATYSFDGEGKRVRKVSATENTTFVYDASGELIEEYAGGLVQTAYVYAGSSLLTTETSSGTNYLTADHLGSPRIVTDASGNVTSRKDYTAFGEENVTPQRTDGLGYNPQNVRQDYTGYQKDNESSLEYAQARYYNPLHGRFTSVDPLTASAAVRDPQTFNRYSYGLNSPYKFTDALGLIYLESAGACAQWCTGRGPYVDGSDFRGTDTTVDWMPHTLQNLVARSSDAKGNPIDLTASDRTVLQKNLQKLAAGTLVTKRGQIIVTDGSSAGARLLSGIANSGRSATIVVNHRGYWTPAPLMLMEPRT